MRERPFSNLYIFGSGVNVENVNLGQCRYSVQIFFRPKAYPTCVSSKFCKFIEFIDPQTIDFKPFSTRRHPTIPQLPIISCTFFVNPPSTLWSSTSTSTSWPSTFWSRHLVKADDGGDSEGDDDIEIWWYNLIGKMVICDSANGSNGATHGVYLIIVPERQIKAFFHFA